MKLSKLMIKLHDPCKHSKTWLYDPCKHNAYQHGHNIRPSRNKNAMDSNPHEIMLKQVEGHSHQLKQTLH